jgi:tyrosyl-DNA phosphodiesterase 2
MISWVHSVIKSLFGPSFSMGWSFRSLFSGRTNPPRTSQTPQPPESSIRFTGFRDLSPAVPPEYYEPRPLPWFSYEGGEWRRAILAASDETDAATGQPPLDKIRVVTWNIDAFVPAPGARITAALSHLQQLVSSPPEPFTADTPIVIMLQEMRESDLNIIQETAWIRERFYITDLDPAQWPTYYGTTMLIDRRLRVKGVFRVRWKSNMGRDGLFVDIEAGAREGQGDGKGEGEGGSSRTLRFCNSHLESLRADPPRRPAQMATAAEHLRLSTVHGGVLAGDMNAVQPFDGQIGGENGLTDAFLALGGEEGSAEGHTWGYQSPKWQQHYGQGRLDKVFCCGGLEARQLVRIGVDVRVDDKEALEALKEKGFGPWVTDHYGLMAELAIV